MAAVTLINMILVGRKESKSLIYVVLIRTGLGNVRVILVFFSKVSLFCHLSRPPSLLLSPRK